MGFQEHRTEGRRQGQRVQSGETDGDSHCKTELLVEHTCGAGHERYGDKHKHHHKSNRDDGAADLVHGVDRSLARALVAGVKLGMHRLDHHNGVVDHNRDRKHESREGDEVKREAYDVEHKERTDQGHRDGNGGDDGRTDVLQEDVDHNEHQNECLDEGVDNLVD